MTETTIGVDISKDRLDAHRLPDGATGQFPNSKAGHRAFLEWAGQDVARIVYEPTGPYHRAFEGALARTGLPLCKVNPKKARRFAEAIGTLAKTDRIDARMLARMGQLLEPESRPVADEALGSLRELLLVRRALIKERTAVTNRRHTLTIALLRRQHTQRLAQIERQLLKIDQAIMAMIKEDPTLKRRFEILMTIPGVANVTAFTMLIDMPELGTMDAKQAAALCGLAPLTRQSGQWRGRAMIGGGRRLLRQALYMPAMVAARYNDDLRATYERLKANGKPGKLAITAVMRKLIILANALIRDDREWAPRMA
ncbi:IS110 family transposase [Parvularcula oceani]|uniref:IS110 family transposase n=1 Tax=Parvularcula oceani TaxID=1247963 RepID=UPI0004E1C604|nr:IS110 family transposase [Parvularcula oceani]